MSALAYVGSSTNSASANFGGLGSTHEHAIFLVVIDGSPVDFRQDKYQVKSPFIHVENGVGTTLHKHALRVPVGEFFKSLGMQVEEGCFVSDDGSSYCTGEGKRLRFFVGETEIQTPSAINGYVLSDGDSFLLYYGEDNEDAIQAALESVNRLTVST